MFPFSGGPELSARMLLDRLDGEKYFAGLLSLDFADPMNGPDFVASDTDFIQCAGNSVAMTVELSELADDGSVRRWVLGRSGVESGGLNIIRWSVSGSAEVSHSEVWDADSASELFVQYYKGGAAGVDASRRLVEENRYS